MDAIVEALFQTCVNILIVLGGITGLGYKGVNVLIFVFLVPGIMAAMAVRIHRLEQQIPEARNTMEMLSPLLWVLGGLVLFLTYALIAANV